MLRQCCWLPGTFLVFFQGYVVLVRVSQEDGYGSRILAGL